MESAFDKQMPGILKVMNNGFRQQLLLPPVERFEPSWKQSDLNFFYSFWWCLTLKSNGKFNGNIVWLEMVLPNTEKDLNVWNRSVFTKFSSPLSWTLWNLFSCVTRCVACVFLQCVASGFPVRIMSRTRKYPFDLCFLVPTTHVILIISTEMTWHCPCKSPYCYVLLRSTAITNLLNKCSCGSYCSPHHST